MLDTAKIRGITNSTGRNSSESISLSNQPFLDQMRRPRPREERWVVQSERGSPSPHSDPPAPRGAEVGMPAPSASCCLVLAAGQSTGWSWLRPWTPLPCGAPALSLVVSWALKPKKGATVFGPPPPGVVFSHTYLLGGKTKAQRGYVTCRCHSGKWLSWDLYSLATL